MDDLATKRCKPCEGGVDPLTREEAVKLLSRLHADWTLSPDGKEIERAVAFRSYDRVIAFVNAVAWIAHREDHHPDLEVGYSGCTVRYSTHAVDGLSDNDFICAAKVDALLA